MNKTIRKNICGLMLLATFALAMTSCQKEQNDNKTNFLKDGKPPYPVCAAIPQILQVPDGNRLVLQTFAKGVQIYQVKRSATDANAFSWVNIAPLATLYTRPDFTNPVINHFAGPSWQFTKGLEQGEKVVGAKLQGITQDATAVQWLLLKAVDSLSTPDNKISYIQRICTAGGIAPANGADEAHLGALDSIPYTASYLFYSKN